MRSRRNTAWGLGVLIGTVIGGGAAADVVVDMPAPQARPSGVTLTIPSAEYDTQDAMPTVGQVALHRYARTRVRPRDTYYDPRAGRFFGGYAAPYYAPFYYPWGYGFGCWGYPYYPYFTFRVTGITTGQ